MAEWMKVSKEEEDGEWEEGKMKQRRKEMECV